MIPIRYNLRNLRARWKTTLMTVLAIAFVVFASVLTFGLTSGMAHVLEISGDPLELVILRDGANDETSSGIERQVADELATLPEVAKSPDGQPLCSIEYATILTKPRRGNGGTTNLIVRGVGPVGRQLRPGFRIVEGRDIRPGVNEIITSRAMAERFQNLAIGEQLDINNVAFTVVGLFEAGGSSAESEVWCDRRDLTAARREGDAVTSVYLRAVSQEAADKLKRLIPEDKRFKLKAVDEVTYFQQQTQAMIMIRFVSGVIAAFLTFGAMFAAANTMFAAVASRAREIGTLRALGFPRSSIVFSFLLESVIICLAGGILGCLATLPAHGLTTGTANWNTFAEMTFGFRFTPDVLLRGVLLALAMGLLGGLFPAIRAVRMRTVDALRQA